MNVNHTQGPAGRSLEQRIARLEARAEIRELVAQFHGRFAVLGPSSHFTHDHVIEFDDQDDARAGGLVNAHAEVVRGEKKP